MLSIDLCDIIARIEMASNHLFIETRVCAICVLGGTILIRLNSVTATYIIIRFLVIIVAIRQLYLGNYMNVFTSFLTLLMLMLPSILAKRFHITMPSVMEITFIVFIFCAEILGEISLFYLHIDYWDKLLHLTNGFMMAALGFSILIILARSENTALRMNAAYAIVFAFCFSMTVAVLWEFIEFSLDVFLGMDSQKDTIINGFSSVVLQEDGSGNPLRAEIETIVINGVTWDFGGYIDIGLIDTMLDMILNAIGAFAFIIIYILSKSKEVFLEHFLLRFE